MHIKAIGGELVIELNDGSTLTVQGYTRIDGLAGDLADGASFTTHDGCVATRRGDETTWWTPPGKQ